jgi:hypothetical protein
VCFLPQILLPNTALNKTVVLRLQGEALAARAKAFGYAECSAKQMTNVKEVFELAGRASLTCPPGGGGRSSAAAGGGGGCCVLC